MGLAWLVEWAGGWKKNISAPSFFGFRLYFSTSTPNFIKIGLKVTELGFGVISAGVVGWAGRWENNPNSFKL